MKSLNVATPEVHESASTFVERVKGLSFNEREKEIEKTLLAGNVPSHMRQFVNVTLAFTDAKKVPHSLTIHVLPDYLTLGNDDDNLLIPMNPLTAQKLADEWGCMLPTTKLVTLLWNAAPVKLAPQPWGPPYDASMHSTQRYVAHDARVKASMTKAGLVPGQLVGGHKKDVVLSNRLLIQPKQVAIFGWIQSNGKPIQPLSLIHERDYSDYAHGIRMIAIECELDGVQVHISSVLQDKDLCVALSNEGPLQVLRQPGT